MVNDAPLDKRGGCEMRIRFSAPPVPVAEPSSTADQQPSESSASEVAGPVRSRPGTTSMEYLVMLSFIFLAIILAVQGIGAVTGGLFKSSADATAKTNEP
jgi:Flp pilus assembly pilin Flp